MIKLTNPKDLSEGDWLEEDVKLQKGIIKKSVHGLSVEEIDKLRKTRRKILIKQGIPFTPVSFITLIIIEFFYLKGLRIENFLPFL